MTELLLWAAGIAILGGLFWVSMWVYGRLQAAKAELAMAEHLVETARRMSEAEAKKPKTTEDMVNRLRRHGL